MLTEFYRRFKEISPECDYPRFLFLLSSNEIDCEELLPEDMSYNDCLGYQEVTNALGAEFHYEFVESQGGGSGGDGKCSSVFKVKGDFYKTEYYHCSSSEFNYKAIGHTLKKVVPSKRVITVYS